MQSVTFTLPTDREGFTAWLEAWWPDWSYRQLTISTGDTGGYLSLSNPLTQEHRRGAVVLKAELAYMLPKQEDPTCLTCYVGLRGFEWAIVPLGAGRCQVKFTTQDARLLHLYWPALQAVMLRWPDMQFIEIRPPIEGSAPEVQPAGSAPEVQPARDDGPDPDGIPQWGTRRDLSTHEVRTIVKRCNQYRQLPGGSIAKFHERESWKWPDPDDAPKGYSLKTLQKWVNMERFQ